MNEARPMKPTVPDRGTDMVPVEKALGWRAWEQKLTPRNHRDWLEKEAAFHGDLGKPILVLCGQNSRPFL